MAPLVPNRVSIGSARTFTTPYGARPGPTPRRGGFLLSPATTKPTMSVASPGPERARAEKLTIRLAGCAATVIVTVAVVVPPALVACNVTTNVPATVGVPLISPVRGFKVRPAGRPVAT